MPYYTTSAAQFKPYTFQEMVQPLALYKSRYDEIDKLAQAQEDASAAARDQALADPTVRAMWMKYENSLNKLRDKIASSGLSNEDYALSNEVRRQFRDQVIPITGAISRREQQRKEWVAAHGNDDTYFGDRPELHNLSEYLNGNIPTLAAYSGDKIAARAAVSAKAISSRKFHQAINKVFGGNFIDFVNRQGIETANNTIMGLLQSGAYPELNEVYNSMMSGVNPQYQQEASRYIIKGITDGLVYSETHQYQQNPDAIFARQMALTQARAAGRKGSGSGSGTEDNSLRPYSRVDKVKQGVKPKDHTRKGEDVTFLKNMVDNPNWYWNRLERNNRYYNKERFDQINKRYGLNLNLDNISDQKKLRDIAARAYERLNKSYNDEISLVADYHFDISDDKYMADVIRSRTALMGEKGGYGMHRVKRNGVTKALTEDEYNEIDWSKPVDVNLLGDGTWQLNVTSGSGKNAKQVQYIIEPDALTDNPEFTSYAKQYKGIKDKRGDEASSYVDVMMNILYGQYYAMPQIQSATSAKADPYGYIDNMYYDLDM